MCLSFTETPPAFPFALTGTSSSCCGLLRKLVATFLASDPYTQRIPEVMKTTFVNAIFPLFFVYTPPLSNTTSRFEQLIQFLTVYTLQCADFVNRINKGLSKLMGTSLTVLHVNKFLTNE